MKTQFLTALAVFIVIAVLGIVVQIVIPKSTHESGGIIRLRIGNAAISSEVADTPAEQVKGLSYRESMARDHGMLFRFSTPGSYDFWMKDTNFPLDFVWIRDNRVVGITENALPEDPPRTIYSPPTQIDSMLEINAGVAREAGIKIGDTVEMLP